MENINTLIKLQKENQLKTETIDSEYETNKDDIQEQINGVEDLYNKHIRELQDEKDNKIRVFRELDNMKKSERDKVVGELYQATHNLIRIMELLKTKARYEERLQEGYDIKVLDTDVKQYDRDSSNKKYFEWLEYVYNDEFMTIRLLIAQNSKPTNKYSLIAYGRCIFHEEKMLKLPYTYGIHLDDNRGLNIKSSIKDSSSVQELKDYVARNKGKMFKEFINQFEELKKEYLEVIEAYKIEDFEEYKVFKDYRRLKDEEQKEIEQDFIKQNGESAKGDYYGLSEFYENNQDLYNYKMIKIGGREFY